MSKKIHFSEFELRLVEYASGKLTINEIYYQLKAYFDTFAISKEKALADVLSFYRDLSRNLLLMFREIV